MQLSSALTRFYFFYERNELPVFISTIIISTFFIASFFSIITFYVLHFIDVRINTLYTDMEFFFISSIIFFTVLNTTIERILLNELKGSKLLVRAIYSNIISFSVILILIYFYNMKEYGFLFGLLSGYAFVSLFSIFLIRNWIVIKFNKEYLFNSVSYSWPIIFHALSGTVFMYGVIFF